MELPALTAERHRVHNRGERRRWLPVWVRGLEAWADGAWPPGAYGRSAVQAVLAQVVEHYRQEHALREVRGRACVIREE